MNWSDLSMSQRSELMSIYLKNGITSLDEMKKHYNSFAEGGNIDNPPERFFGIATPEVTDNNIYYSRNSLLPEVNITAKGDPRKVNNDYYKAHAAERAAFQDKVARRVDQGWVPRTMLGLAALPFAVEGAATIAPTVGRILTHPLVDAALTTHGAITAPKNAVEGINEIKAGNYGKGALDLGLTALDITGWLGLTHNVVKGVKNIKANKLEELKKAVADNYATIVKNKPDTSPYVPMSIQEIRDLPVSMEEKQRLLELYVGGENSRMFSESFAEALKRSDNNYEKFVYPLLDGINRTPSPTVNSIGILSKDRYNEDILRRNSGGTTYPNFYKFNDGTEVSMLFPEEIYREFDAVGNSIPNIDKLRSIINHERRHDLQNFHENNLSFKDGYTETERKLLRDAYPAIHVTKGADSGLMVEKGATNTQLRLDIANKYKSANIEDLLSTIDNMPENELLDMLNATSTYGKDYTISINKFKDPFRGDQIRKLREALKYVPIAGMPMMLNNEYSNGGKIFIKPENRGKFTALKKRTGHSASWFKENGTPAQKKMAVFELNSRKWRK